MRLTSVLAKRHLDTYHVGFDDRQLGQLERLLEDVYLAGRGTSFNGRNTSGYEAAHNSPAALEDERLPSTGDPCPVFSALGLFELRCARCGAPAWRHDQPITLSSSLQASIDGEGRD